MECYKRRGDKKLASLNKRLYLVLDALNISLTCFLNLSLDPQLLIW